MSSSRPANSRRRSSSRGDTDDFVSECTAAFMIGDSNMTGKLTTKSGLLLALQNTGRNPSNKSLNKYWAESTRSINLEEFREICRQEKVTTEDDLVKAFKKIDKNGDGFLSHKELKAVMTSRGEKMSDSEVRDMIREFDENDDGKLDYKEFTQMILETSNQCKDKAVKKYGGSKSRSGHDEGRNSAAASPRLSHRDRGKYDGSKSRSGHDEGRNSSAASPRLSHRDRDVTDRSSSRDRRNGLNGSQASLRSERSNRTTPLSPRANRKPSPTASLRNVNSKSSSPVPDISDDTDIIVSAAPKSTKYIHDRLTSPQPRPRARLASSGMNSPDGVSPKPAPRRSSHQEKDAVADLKSTLSTPRDLKRWRSNIKKSGMFYMEQNGNIMANQYSLTVTKHTTLWLTISPNPSPSTAYNPDSPLDVCVYITRQKLDRSGHVLVAFSDQRDSTGKSGLKVDLEPGTYNVLPHTSGCRLPMAMKKKSTAKELVQKTQEGHGITKTFKAVLNDIFKMMDTDLDGKLSREEFAAYCLRTGEDLGDEEWKIVEENVELKNNMITLHGFIQLIELEADDAAGETDDLWDTLESLGYDQSLTQTQAHPFLLEVGAKDDSRIELQPESSLLHPKNKFITAAIQEAVQSKTDPLFRVHDVDVYCYETDHNVTVLLHNKSSSRAAVKLDLSACRNVKVTGNKTPSVFSLPVNGDSHVVACQIVPADETKPWYFSCVDGS